MLDIHQHKENIHKFSDYPDSNLSGGKVAYVLELLLISMFAGIKLKPVVHV